MVTGQAKQAAFVAGQHPWQALQVRAARCYTRAPAGRRDAGVQLRISSIIYLRGARGGVEPGGGGAPFSHTFTLLGRSPTAHCLTAPVSIQQGTEHCFR